MTENKRFRVHEVSVGAAGLTQRPAVYDSLRIVPPRFFREGERHIAEKLADQLNREHEDA